MVTSAVSVESLFHPSTRYSSSALQKNTQRARAVWSVETAGKKTRNSRRIKMETLSDTRMRLQSKEGRDIIRQDYQEEYSRANLVLMLFDALDEIAYLNYVHQEQGNLLKENAKLQEENAKLQEKLGLLRKQNANLQTELPRVSLCKSQGIDRIAIERNKQMSRFSKKHDSVYTENQLPLIAASLCVEDHALRRELVRKAVWPPEYQDKWNCLDRYEQLAIAGALCAAEIDRIMHEEKKEKK